MIGLFEVEVLWKRRLRDGQGEGGSDARSFGRKNLFLVAIFWVMFAGLRGGGLRKTEGDVVVRDGN